jgi:hypothetical protein
MTIIGSKIMVKCGLCGKECEDFTKSKYSIFYSDTPMCRDCYDKFLSKNFNEIINAIIDSTVPKQNVDLIHEIFDDFNIYNRLYNTFTPSSFLVEPMSIVKIAEDKEK